jgi:hypothetical protein
MRQWWKMVALGAVATMVVATPAAALGGNGDETPQRTTERVAERVMDQNQARFGQPDVTQLGDQDMDQARDRLQRRDGTGTNCTADCDGDQARDRDRDQARDQLRDRTGENCSGDCEDAASGDRDRLRQRLHDCGDGCEVAWQLAQAYGWTMHVAI